MGGELVETVTAIYDTIRQNSLDMFGLGMLSGGVIAAAVIVGYETVSKTLRKYQCQRESTEQQESYKQQE